MAKFIARIELLEAEPADYEKLNGEMRQRNFSRIMVAVSGRQFSLPSGMYRVTEGELTAQSVRNLAKEAANTTRKRSWVLALEYRSAAWSLGELPELPT